MRQSNTGNNNKYKNAIIMRLTILASCLNSERKLMNASSKWDNTGKKSTTKIIGELGLVISSPTTMKQMC